LIEDKITDALVLAAVHLVTSRVPSLDVDAGVIASAEVMRVVWSQEAGVEACRRSENNFQTFQEVLVNFVGRRISTHLY